MVTAATTIARGVVAAGVAVVFAAAPFACADRDDGDRPRAFATSGGSTASGFVQVDAGDGFCGNEIHEPINQPPLLYFVVDSSGSMSERIDGVTKHEILKQAAVDVTRSLGALIRVGAAVFPTDEECGPGEETMAPREGDGAGQTATTTAFEKALARPPIGGTPTSATLASLRERFHAPGEGEGQQALILITDGGPNCVVAGDCSAAECQLNIEGTCPMSESCCTNDERIFCLDRAATLAAIEAFGDIDTKVYVVGLALAPEYDDVMSQMALAGGAPRDEAPYYYQADDAAALTEHLRKISAALVSCTFVMQNPPDDAGLVNVYFGKQAVPFDPMNGWQWRDERTIDLVGDACASLRSGAVQDVHIVTGCPTVTPT